jgi:hypothetical protein
MTDLKGGFSMERITGSKSTMVALAGSVIALLGSFMAWISIDGLGSIGGMEDGNDGVITFIVAIGTGAGAVFLKDKARKISIIVGGVIIAVIGVIDMLDINDASSQLGGGISIGIGLWMVLVGGIIATAGAFISE